MIGWVMGFNPVSLNKAPCAACFGPNIQISPLLGAIEPVGPPVPTMQHVRARSNHLRSRQPTGDVHSINSRRAAASPNRPSAAIDWYGRRKLTVCRTEPPFAGAAFAKAENLCTCGTPIAPLRPVSPKQSLNLVARRHIQTVSSLHSI